MAWPPSVSRLRQSSARARLQHRVRGAQALRFAAGGLAGAIAVVPRIDIEVRPLLLLRDEALEVERRSDAAGHLRRAAVGDIGNRAGEIAPVRTPQRHAPQRIAQL